MVKCSDIYKCTWEEKNLVNLFTIGSNLSSIYVNSIYVNSIYINNYKGHKTSLFANTSCIKCIHTVHGVILVCD